MSSPITFVVPGQPDTLTTPAATRSAQAGFVQDGDLGLGPLKQTVRVATLRGGAAEVRVTATPGEDVVVLRLADGPVLVLHPEHARDLLLAQSAAPRRGAATPTDLNEVRVPVQLRWEGLEESVPERSARSGWLGKVLLSFVQVFAGPLQTKAARKAGQKIGEYFDSQVVPGVYKLKAEALPKLKGLESLAENAVPPAIDGGPLLFFIHGTFSETHGTFSKLWTHHPDQVGALFKSYGGRVYALEHETLSKSPLDNALLLLEALPRQARLHLVTHSRGGLVAEVLARVCNGAKLGERDLAFFAAPEWTAQQQVLNDIQAQLSRKKITVERVVRVACPARGTLLASKRLDAYVSVIKWLLEQANVPLAPGLIGFLGEVAQRRLRADELPGLAAQVPDSPLVQWLHASEEPLAGQLRVVAGDMQGDSLVSWLKTLLADGFYWTDNDLVVQTRSMYGGASRSDGASFVLDRGASVSHFSYFENERTARAVVDGLLQERPAAYRPIGPLSWAGEAKEAAEGWRAAVSRPVSSPRDLPQKPALFLLPGILGSHLKVNGLRVWLSGRLVGGLDKLRYGGDAHVEPDAPIGAFYGRLADWLTDSHAVVEFPFDWRRPLEEEAERLADSLTEALDARESSGQPVRILAHSMGGLLARTMQLVRPDVWERLFNHRGAHLLMLGTPNDGSWAPMQVLSGDDLLGNTLTLVGAPFREKEARTLFAQYPGFLQLQAGLLDQQLDKRETWQKLADVDAENVRRLSLWHSDELQRRAHDWGIPAQDVLDQASKLQRRLRKQSVEVLPRYKDRLLLVVGSARRTPSGYEIEERKGLVYVDQIAAGDGRVTHRSAVLPGIRSWELDCEHASMANKSEAFSAFLDLLERGDTDRLPRLGAAGMRGTAQLAIEASAQLDRPRASRGGDGTPPSSPSQLLEQTKGEAAVLAPELPALRITVINGNLKFVRQALLIGHYQSAVLTGSEDVIDKLIGGTMRESMRLGQYPSQPRTHQIFENVSANPENPLQLPRPRAVIVVGLGEEGKLKAEKLASTVEHGVLAWAQRERELRHDAGPFELAATLLGSGGTGITAGQAAQLVAQGVRDANQRLAAVKWPTVSHLHLVELYLDRASEAWRALRVQATATRHAYNLSSSVRTGSGPLLRPLESGYRGANYDLVTAVTQVDAQKQASIAYTLDTRRARTEVRAQSLQRPLLRELVASASNDRNNDPQIGRTLFQLLIPLEMEPFLGGTSEMVIELDEGTAGLPWELLDTGARGQVGGNSEPWSIRCKLLRKLRTVDFRPQVVDATPEDDVLVIGDPKCDRRIYPVLPGARSEAGAVAKCFKRPGVLQNGSVHTLFADGPKAEGADARAVINGLFAREYRVLHIAAHGTTPMDENGLGGVVLSNGTLLGPQEIENMRVVPELVFLNCCYLAASDEEQLLTASARGGYDRPHFAARIAEKLISIGVRCVIAAGWAVDDAAALTFATRFYDALLSDARFVDAITEARKAARGLGGNTWAAYQCYGDPDWRFRSQTSDAQTTTPSIAENYADVATHHALVLAIKAVVVDTTFEKTPPEVQRARLRHLESRCLPEWRQRGDVAEAFADAWATAGDRDHAIGWYSEAIHAQDGSASWRATEQLWNWKARAAEKRGQAAVERMPKREAVTTPAKKARSKARTAPASKAGPARKNEALEAAIKELEEACEMLEQLAKMADTSERSSLCGSACKRLSMLEAHKRTNEHELADEERKALLKMRGHYANAEAITRRNEDPKFFYPALNRMAAALLLHEQKGPPSGFEGESLAEIRRALARTNLDDPDFWTVVGMTELRLLEALAHHRLDAAERNAIRSEYEDLHERVRAPSMWESVHDQLRFLLLAPRLTSEERPLIQGLVALVEPWCSAAQSGESADG